MAGRAIVYCHNASVLHFRIVCPVDRADALDALLVGYDALINIVRMPSAARRPDGDLFLFDAAPEAGNRLITQLRSLGIDQLGSIAIERIDTSLSDAARRAEIHEPGDSAEAVIWEDVEARSRDESGTSPSYIALMVLASLIAAVAILTDSPVLVIGAMVVGPEYGPISGVVVGLHRRRPARVRRGLKSLLWGFVAAIAGTAVMTGLLRALGWIPDAYLSGDRPITSFISAPDQFAVIVAVLAGAAGALSLAQLRLSTIVGVLVSVTTIPAAANVAVAVVNERYGEAGGALGQLVLNVSLLCLAGAATLSVERHLLLRRVRRAADG